MQWQVLRGVSKEMDAEALKAVRKWHLNPARNKWGPVTALLTLDVNFWLDRDGKLVQANPTPTEPTGATTKP